MSAKRFHVSRPDMLTELEGFAKETPNSIGKIRNIWISAIKRKGATRWDRALYVCFSGSRVRDAALIRFAADGEIVRVCGLSYNLALRYCQSNMRQVQDQ
ncbi:MAG: hypothetical protein IJ649_00150 [Oscillospiraceae bacterium]|nr:hypothetical protein [Oscillospiraceae bacterium]